MLKLADTNDASQRSTKHGYPHQFKEFLLLFIPIALLIALGTWILGESRLKAETSILKAEEKTYVDLAMGRLDHELAVPIRHLISLVNEKPVRQVYEAQAGSDDAQMEEAFISLMSRNPSYDKARWIDERGMERVRVNNRQDGPVLVPKNQLQDKHDRYFFTETMALDPGVIYVSPLDLNMENGQIELPYKPTLRVAMRVFKSNGRAHGILIINIAARSMLDAFVGSAGPASDRMMLLNAEGYWLKSPVAADEWGFMFNNDVNMANRNPRLWDQVSTQKEGQMRLSDGLWTWNTVSPVPERNIRLSNNINWKVISRLPASDFQALEKQIWPAKILSALVLLVLFGFGIYRLVQAKAARSDAEKLAELARKEAEAAHRLQEAQAGFRMLFEANTSGLIVVDEMGGIAMVNPAFQRMFGYDEEILRQPVEILVPEAIRSGHVEWREAYLQHPESRGMGDGRELYGMRKDGVVFPIEIGLSPYRDNGRTFVLATVVDISERKAAQDQILKMNEVLEQRVAERTEELQNARQEAERLASVKGNFLANMSHEIRTPMNAILGLAYLLEKGKLDEDERGLVKKIRIAGRSLLGIINDILDFSKIESGRLEIERAPFRLNDVLDNVATLMSAVEYSHHVELIMAPAPDGMEFLTGDALRLEQVLVNLTSNALKFTERGSVSVTVETLFEEAGKGCLKFKVTDTGKGISVEKQSDIFNAFAQEDTSTTRRFGGTGLGLSICRCLVQLMGGEIGVVSELGKGSEFWFTLPVVQIEPLDYVQPTMIFQNVLIADDHPVAREVLVAIVRSLGWIPEVVSSGEEAVRRTLERAQNNKLPDLLLLDWRMPGTDGLAAASQITQALGNIPNRPFVVIATAHDHELLAKEPGAEVADAILSKPLTASALYNAVIEKQRSLEKVTVLSDSEIDVSGRRIQGLRILVVDDSEINRDMARRILEQEGANVDLVDDGQSAVDWLRVNSDQTDVVLMDIQMPLMDGYEATRQIREILKLTTLPIIALTAGAFKNQQTAALQAGMNGFVAKPFDVDELITLLRQYLGDQPSENPVSISHGDNPSPDKSVRVIDWERGLRNWGDQMTYHNYLRKFIDAHSKDGDHIKALISSFDTDRARVLAHKLKGTAGNLAIMQVWALAEQIESLLSEDGNVADYPHELQLALDTVASELSALAPPTAEASEAVTDVADRESAVKLLRELLLALDRDNPDEAEPSLIALQSMLPIQMLTPIREQLDSFDFRAAELQTQALIKEINLTLEEV